MRPELLLGYQSRKNNSRKTVVSFLPIVQVFRADDIERKNSKSFGRKSRSTEYMTRVKRQLNRYKAKEMEVHPDSKKYTEFHLV